MMCPSYLLARSRVFAAAGVAVALVAAALAACSSDPESSLGSTADLIGSDPGEVYQDSISVTADTTYAFNTMIAADSTMEFGRVDGYTRTLILQPGFAELTETDKQRVVESATLRLVPASISGSFPARFYRLRNSYKEGDSFPAVDTVYAIPDPGNGSPTRALQNFPVTYALPKELVQGWIRGDSTRVAIAVVYTDGINERVATFNAREAASNRPRLQVNFAGGIQRNYAMGADAVFIRPVAPPGGNLVISDGYARRVYLRASFDELAEDAAVHTARLRMHLVPGTVLGDNTTAVVYIPDSTDPTRQAFRTGQLVTEKVFAEGDETVEFVLTNAVFLTLQGRLNDNGFVIRFKDENTELRQAEFYGSDAAEALRPRVFITSSTPAEFRP